MQQIFFFNMLKGKKILITGGTGSLGKALTKKLLGEGVETIRIFSRNERQQIEMESKFDDNRLRFLLGDVRDFDSVIRATNKVDTILHLAALIGIPYSYISPLAYILSLIHI